MSYLFVGDREGKLENFVIHLTSWVVFLSMGKSKVSHVLKIYQYMNFKPKKGAKHWNVTLENM